MREYDKLEEVEKRARVVIKSTGKVWVAREWVGVGSDCGSLDCLLSNDRTATHRIHVHILLSVCAYCWLTRAHVPHGWVCCLVGGAGAPPTKKEREREWTGQRERVPPRWAGERAHGHRNYRIAHTPLSSTTPKQAAPAAATAGGAKKTASSRSHRTPHKLQEIRLNLQLNRI